MYSDDPVTHPDAKRYEHMNYRDVTNRRLGVMDVAAVVMCEQNRIPIVVFSLKEPGNMRAVVEGQSRGTLIDDAGPDG